MTSPHFSATFSLSFFATSEKNFFFHHFSFHHQHHDSLIARLLSFSQFINCLPPTSCPCQPIRQLLYCWFSQTLPTKLTSTIDLHSCPIASNCCSASNHSSCCHDFYNYDWLLIFQPAFTNYFPLVVHPANSPYLTSSIHTATTSKHNSCCHDFYNYDWLLIVQPANTTGIDNSKCNEIHNRHRQHPPQFVLQFPLK